MFVRRLLFCLAVIVGGVLASGSLVAPAPASTGARCIATVSAPQSSGYRRVRGTGTARCFLADTVTARLCIAGPTTYDCTSQTFAANPFRQRALSLDVACGAPGVYYVTLSGTAETTPFNTTASGVTCPY